MDPTGGTGSARSSVPCPEIFGRALELGLLHDEHVARAGYTSRGTHLGELFGVAPTGRAPTTGGIEIYRLEGGRIVECWNAYDMSEPFGSVC